MINKKRINKQKFKKKTIKRMNENTKQKKIRWELFARTKNKP